MSRGVGITLWPELVAGRQVYVGTPNGVSTVISAHNAALNPEKGESLGFGGYCKILGTENEELAKGYLDAIRFYGVCHVTNVIGVDGKPVKVDNKIQKKLLLDSQGNPQFIVPPLDCEVKVADGKQTIVRREKPVLLPVLKGEENVGKPRTVTGSLELLAKQNKTTLASILTQSKAITAAMFAKQAQASVYE